MVDVRDESQSREETLNSVVEPIDYIDESTSRGQGLTTAEPQSEQCELNTLTMDYVHESVTVIDIHNNSHPRPMIPSGYRLKGKEKQVSSDDIDKSSCRTFKPVLLGEKDSDESRSRDCRPEVEVKCSQKPMGETQMWSERYQTDMGASIDEPSSPPNRCSMSMHQQMEQLVTPVR